MRSECDIQTGIVAGSSRSSPVRRIGERDHGVPVLAPRGGSDAPAERLRQQLHPVADAEHRQPGAYDIRRQRRRALVVDGGGAAGEHEALHLEVRQLLGSRVPGRELGVDAGLADAPRNQHRELRAVVEHDDRLGRFGGRGQQLAGRARLGDLEVGTDFAVAGGANAITRPCDRGGRFARVDHLTPSRGEAPSGRRSGSSGAGSYRRARAGSTTTAPPAYTRRTNVRGEREGDEDGEHGPADG